MNKYNIIEPKCRINDLSLLYNLSNAQYNNSTDRIARIINRIMKVLLLGMSLLIAYKMVYTPNADVTSQCLWGIIYWVVIYLIAVNVWEQIFFELRFYEVPIVGEYEVTEWGNIYDFIDILIKMNQRGIIEQIQEEVPGELIIKTTTEEKPMIMNFFPKYMRRDRKRLLHDNSISFLYIDEMLAERWELYRYKTRSVFDDE